MQLESLVKTIVFVMIAAMITVIATPILDMGSKEVIVQNNDGAFYATPDSETHQIAVSLSSEGITIETDGEECRIPEMNRFNVVFGQTDYTRVTVSSGDLRLWTNTNTHYDVTLSETPTIITITEGIVTMSGTALSFAATHYIAHEGDYVLTNSPYVKSDTELVSIGQYTISPIYNSNLILQLASSGTLEAIDTDVLYTTNTYTNVSAGDAVIDSTYRYSDLYRINSVTVPIYAKNVSTGKDTVTNVEISSFLVPVTITVDNPHYAGAGAPLISIIPLIIFAGLVLIVVQRLISNRE